jgi:DNA-directed RNA polymerase subunit RPC12/RpoP
VAFTTNQGVYKSMLYYALQQMADFTWTYETDQQITATRNKICGASTFHLLEHYRDDRSRCPHCSHLVRSRVGRRNVSLENRVNLSASAVEVP